MSSIKLKADRYVKPRNTSDISLEKLPVNFSRLGKHAEPKLPSSSSKGYLVTIINLQRYGELTMRDIKDTEVDTTA